MICRVITIIKSTHFEPWIKTGIKDIKRKSCGFVVKKKDKFFIVTTLHGIRFANKIIIEFENKDSIILEERSVHQIYEADLTVIEFKKDDIKYFTFGNERGESKLIYEEEEYSIKVIKKEFAIRNDERFFSLFSPPLEKFIIEIDDDEFYESKKLRGMSGLPVFNNKDEVFGMIIENIPQTKKIILLSYKVIDRVISEIEETRCFRGFCGLYCDFIIYTDEEEKTTNNYLVVTNTYEINYNKFDTDKKGFSNLNQYDIIESIEDKLIFNGKVEIEDELVPIKSFICNNFKAGDLIKLKLHRQAKNSDEMKIRNISLQARPYNTVYSISPKSDTYFEYKGLVIKQLTTEEAIFLDNIKGIETKNIFDKVKIYENNPLPIFIIVDVIKENIRSKDYIRILELQLPFKKCGDKYLSFQIIKINNKIPKSEKDIINIIKKQQKTKLLLEVNDESFLLTL